MKYCSLFVFLSLLAVVGCTRSDPAEFRLNMPEIVSNQIIPEHQKAIANTLEAMFGTPDEPFALPETGLDATKLRLAAGPVWSEEDGTAHGLYRQHCAHCHGITGGGRGPTAMFLNPYPRDYRPAIFKFKSTYNPARPTSDDLHRVLMNGVPGTAMPSFALLPPVEVEALVEYVKYLSMRGQMETALINYIADEVDFDPATGEGAPFDPAKDAELRSVIMEELLPDIVEGWDSAESLVIIPEEGGLPADDRTPEQIAQSVEAGRKLFYETRANCVKCHGPTGLGDGQQDDYNVWNKAVVAFHEATDAMPDSLKAMREEMSKLSGEDRAEAKQELQSMQRDFAERLAIGETMFPPRNAIPRNLRQNMYRGGRRPLDIYRKIYTGIAGTPMPGAGPATPGATGTLTEEEMWQIVDYVRSLPFEPASTPRKLRINYDVLN